MVMYMISMISMILLILTLTTLTVMMKLSSSREKQSMFECGFEYMSNLRVPLSIHFYMISIVFLIFDIELILIIPIIFEFKTLSITLIYNIFIIFMVIMMMGLLYEWKMGLINWMI